MVAYAYACAFLVILRMRMCVCAVYFCDAGPELLVWVGKAADTQEKAAAMSTATTYLKQQGKPLTTNICVLKEGAGDRNPTFKKIFSN